MGCWNGIGRLGQQAGAGPYRQADTESNQGRDHPQHRLVLGYSESRLHGGTVRRNCFEVKSTVSVVPLAHRGRFEAGDLGQHLYRPTVGS